MLPVPLFAASGAKGAGRRSAISLGCWRRTRSGDFEALAVGREDRGRYEDGAALMALTPALAIWLLIWTSWL